MTAQEELARRIERDSICRAVQKKIDEGRADFTDTARYTDRAAELLGEVLAAYVPDMPTDERETLCKALLRQRYLDTNAMLNAVQRTLDAAQGLHLAPQIADYPEKRVEQAAHSLADETVPMETIVRRAKSAPATIARSFHDDYIEKNAAFRDSAGLKCYITRNAAAKCCEWCTKMAGRYRYGEEPEDVYRRHDNCSCTVTYENGRKRQDVWSKREWEAPEPGAGAGKPIVFSSFQAKAIELENLPDNLTNETERDTISISSTDGFDSLRLALLNNYGINMHPAVESLDFHSVKEAFEGFEIIRKEYPEIAQQFKTVQLIHGDVMNCDGTAIGFNPLYFGNPPQIESTCKQQSETGYWIKNSSASSLMVHEYAHAIERYLVSLCPDYFFDSERTEAWNECYEAKKIVSKALEEILQTDYGQGKTAEELRLAISRYAGQTESETMAEAFADVFANGENANLFSKIIKKVTRQQLERYQNGE